VNELALGAAGAWYWRTAAHSTRTLDAVTESWWRTEPWWKSLGRVFRWIFGYVFAPMMALGFPILIAYGLMHPRTDDLRALNLSSSEIALLVGVESSSGHFGATGGAAGGGRTYVVIPRAFTDPEIVGITTVNSKSDAQSMEGGAIIVLLTWWACAYATWRFLVVPVSRHLTRRWSGP
jgi:hypothetical protein